MVNVSRPFRCPDCGQSIRLMYCGTGRRRVNESPRLIVRGTGPESRFADQFLTTSGNMVRGYYVKEGDSYYSEAELCYVPHRCSGRKKSMVRGLKKSA